VKRILVVAAIVAMGAAVGCSSPADKTADETSTTRQRIVVTTEAFDPFGLAWGDTVVGEASGVSITVDAPVDDSANLDSFEKDMLDPGTVPMYCMVTMTNNGTEPFAYNVYGFTLFDSANAPHDGMESMFCGQPTLGSGDLLPGRTVTGAITAVVPEGETIAHVDFQPSMMDSTVASWGD
jgi:hypothetical protein